jgi:hypothetical protein
MSNRPLFGALAESAAGEWAAILSLVFGGCCSCARYQSSLTAETCGPSKPCSRATPHRVRRWQTSTFPLPNLPLPVPVPLPLPTPTQPPSHPLTAGTFLTFAQFVYVAVQTFGSQLVWTKGRWVPSWRRNVVPIKRWMVQVVLFFAVSLSASPPYPADNSEQLRLRPQGNACPGEADPRSPSRSTSSSAPAVSCLYPSTADTRPVRLHAHGVLYRTETVLGRPDCA